jgi:hypothetical protein
MSSFNHNPSSLYIAAVNALKALRDAEGVGIAQAAYAEAVHDDLRKSFMKRNQVEAQRGHICTSKLAGMPHVERTCDSPNDIPGHDHIDGWRRGHDTYAITSEPYALMYDDLVKTVQFCQRMGLKADITAGSWHNPGSTILIIYTKRDAAEG